VISNNTSMYSEDSNSSSQSRASTWDLPTGRTGAGAGAVTIRIPFTGPEHGHDATSGSDSYHHTDSSQGKQPSNCPAVYMYVCAYICTVCICLLGRMGYAKV
jgi:hypothetical protein